MSWFNFFNKRYRYVTINGEPQWVIENDPEDVRKYNEFLDNVKTNKGRFVKVYDDITFNEIPLPEIETLEKEREENPNSVYIPFENEEIIAPKKPKHVKESKRVKESNRKHKTRLPISKELRKAILKQHDHLCNRCKQPADQIHHVDNDPSNNNPENLQLLCYYCHKKLHRWYKIQ